MDWIKGGAVGALILFAIFREGVNLLNGVGLALVQWLIPRWVERPGNSETV